MRALTAALLAGLAWAVSACAAPEPAAPNPALWRIADADSEIWLFGSVHVLPPELEWRSARVNAAFASADELVLETDTSESGAAELAALTLRLGALPAGETLSARLDEHGRAALADAARKIGADPAALDRARPWLAALQISYGYAIQQGHDPNAGVEMVLAAEARAAGKPIGFLETPEQQLRTLADLSPEDELRFLQATLRQLEAQDDQLDELDAAWVRGDTEALFRVIDPQMKEAGRAAYDALLTRRNAAWADEIARRLEGSGDVFIAVGAAHLIGPDSVVAMLRARGIAVEGP